MIKFFFYIRQNQPFFVFILLFAYVQSIYSRVLVRGELNIYTFTPEAAIAKLIEVYLLFLVFMFFIKYWQPSERYSTKEMLKIFGSSILGYVLLMQTIGLLIAFLFGTIERNFNWETGALSLPDILRVMCVSISWAAKRRNSFLPYIPPLLTYTL